MTKNTEKTNESSRVTVETEDGKMIDVYCSHSSIVMTDLVKGNPKNPNKHPQSQINLLAKIIREQGWRAPITVSTRSKDEELLEHWISIRDGATIWLEQSVQFARAKGIRDAQFLFDNAERMVRNIKLRINAEK